MADLEWKRPMPTGAWVTVNNPGPGDVAIYRWDPNAKPLGRIFYLNRRQSFVYNVRRRIARILERVTRHD